MIYRVDYVVGSDSRWADCRSAAGSADFIGSRLIEGKTAVQISVRRIDKTTILDASGDIDLSCSLEVRKALLHELRNNRIPRVVVNLNEVRHINSSGVALLVEGLRVSLVSGGRFHEEK